MNRTSLLISSLLISSLLSIGVISVSGVANAAPSTASELQLYSRYSNQASASAMRMYMDRFHRAGRISDIERKLMAVYPDQTRCTAYLRTTRGDVAAISVAEGFEPVTRNPIMLDAGRSYLERARLSLAYGDADGIWIDTRTSVMARALPRTVESQVRDVFKSFATRRHTDRKSIPKSMNKVILLAEVDDDNGGLLAKDLIYRLRLVDVQVRNMELQEIYIPVKNQAGETTTDLMYETRLKADIKTNVLFETQDFRFNCEELKSETELNNEVAPGYSARF